MALEIKFPNHNPFQLFLGVAVFLLASSGCANTTSYSGNETDHQALLAFKAAVTGDPFRALESWNHSINFCKWHGVTCGLLHKRVVKLNLSGRELTGHISPHIGNLSFLRELSLVNNSFTQRIPSELGMLRRLQRISLFNNSVSGEIPVNITACSKLVYLELSINKLDGEIPMEISSLSKLEELYVGLNQLIGVIPASLGNLTSLRVFFASQNSLHGSIPDQFGRWEKLEIFGVGINKLLVGSIPPSMFNISSIKMFDVSDNQLGGLRLPSELGGIIFPRLKYFDVSLNVFDGTIPPSLSNASNLEFLDMGSNKFTGHVPPMEKLVNLWWLNLENNVLGTGGEVDDLGFLSSLTNATYLELLSLRLNNFGGGIPHSFTNVSTSYLRSLYLSNNKMSGSIPEGVGNLINLETFECDFNKFTGKIPSTIGKLNKLQQIELSANKFNGTIPSSFGNLNLLIHLGLGDNNLHGTIPSSLEKCTHLVILTSYLNNLHGAIPRGIFYLSSLAFLGLGGNRFTGFLPAEVGNLVNLEVLDVSQNMLSGQVPSTLGRSVRLTILYLGTNNFGGKLPSLSSLKGLEELDASHNNFSGEFPQYLESFKFLWNLNLSFNDFEGAVPERGVFKNVSAVSVEGNIKLCGGVPDLRLPSCKSKTSKKLNLKLIISTCLGAIAIVLLLSFIYHWRFKKGKKVLGVILPWDSILKLSYQNLHEATAGFSASNLIGMGSFGSVYRGLLDQGQKVVAIKVLNLQYRGASRSFMAECETLRGIRHRNLLKVITACSSIDHQGNDFKALVYEYMANGSLDDWLYPDENKEEVRGNSRSLSLSQRLDIAIDVACALEYLHHHSPEQIVHCDLKPSNILLDNDMIGHVGDFGLAKFLQERTNGSSENQSSTIGVRGTVGYVAPEYGMGNELSTSGDVYSYGILLLEMFTGKRPTHHAISNISMNLHTYVERALPKEVSTVADPTLFFQPQDDASASAGSSNPLNHGSTSIQILEECLVSLLEVGIACSQELPEDRMAINDAIAQLHRIKKDLLATAEVHGRGKAQLAIQS